MNTQINYNQIKGEVVNVFDFMTAAQIADTQTGTPVLDVSAPIQSALDTLRSVYFPDGTYGIATGFNVSMNGRSIKGAGRKNDVNPTTISGTRFKRISGVVNPLVLVSGDDGIFENFAFDNNEAGDYVSIKFTAHGMTVKDVQVYNQGAAGGAGIVLSSVNTSNYYNVATDAMRIEDTLYTNFYGLQLFGRIPGNTLYIKGIVQGVQNCNFYGMLFESSLDSTSIYIEDNVKNVHFYGTTGENSTNVLGSLIIINGDRNLGVEYLAINITFDGFVFGVGDSTNADNQPYFEIVNALNVSISNVYFRDQTSAAGRNYIELDDAKNFSLSNVFDYSAAAHKIVKCVSSCTNVTVSNVHNFAGTVGSMDWTGFQISVRDTDSPQTFTTDAQTILFEQVSGTMNLTNVTQGITILESTGAVTNAPSDGSFAGLTRGSLRLGYATLASATALVLPVFGAIFSVSGTTTITSITGTNAFDGRQITLIFDDVLTFTDGNNLRLAGNFSTSASDTITLVAVGGNFFEIARSAN